MKPILKRAVGVVVAGLAVATAAGLATANADTATLSVNSGTAAITAGNLRDTATDTPFNLALTSGAHCSGNAAAGYVVRSYFIGSGVTLSGVDFGATGLPLPASGTGTGTTFVSALPNVSGAAFAVNPGSSSPFLVTGLPQLSLFRMVNKPAIPTGTYHLGIACVDSTNHVDGNNYWDTLVTISNQTSLTFDWTFGAPPTGSAISGSAGDAQVTLSYTIPTSTPAITSATITGGPSTITLSGGQLTAGAHSGLVVSSLTNGTPYTFTLTASNGVSPDTTSNVTLTPQLATLNNATGISFTNIGATSAQVSWTAAAANTGGQVPTGYELTVNSGTPFAATSPYTLTGLTANTLYTVSVNAIYGVANPVGAASSDSFTTTSATVIVQDISVNRPSGLLVMTQRCYATLPGVGQTIHGDIPSQTAGQAGTGFPTGIPGSTSNTTSSVVGGPGDNGVAPIASETPFATTPADDTFDTTGGLLSGYPYPQNADGTAHAPAYPTRCTINLGNAHLVTTGPNAGQYFAASGQLNQVTVVNSLDSDLGWHVTGTMSNFQNTTQTGPGTFFSGDYLGWTPVRNWMSAPQTDGLGSNYAMSVTAGAGSTQGVSGGLSDGDLLASSPLGSSLGLTQLDARIKLLIPVQLPNGTYHGTLTLSALNG